MASALCMKCSLEFPNELSFAAHKEGGHVDKSGGKPLIGPGVEPPPEFMEAVARIEAKKAAPPEAPAAPERPKLPDPTPIKLEYHFAGECPTCRNPVNTLLLDVKETHVVIAYCSRDNKQLASKEVVKL